MNQQGAYLFWKSNISDKDKDVLKLDPFFLNSNTFFIQSGKNSYFLGLSRN